MHILRLRTCAGTKHPNSDEIRIEITMEKEKEYCKLNAYDNNKKATDTSITITITTTIKITRTITTKMKKIKRFKRDNDSVKH